MGLEGSGDYGERGASRVWKEEGREGQLMELIWSLKKLGVPVGLQEKGNSQYDSGVPTHFPNSLSVTKESQRDFLKHMGAHPVNKLDMCPIFPSI